MRFAPNQLAQYQELGYVVVDCPFPRELTHHCLEAAGRVAGDPADVAAVDSKGNHYRLRPQIPGSFWCKLDHSLPLLQIELHEEIVELARQMSGNGEDIYFRNGGINELAPNRSFKWHRDSGVEYVEFMHYLSGANREDGCLRVVPGSHRGPAESLDDRVAELRAADHSVDRASVHEDDVQLDGEISLEVGKYALIVRSSQIYHATWVNRSNKGRLMHHWLFRDADVDNHRFDFDTYLAPELIARLTPEQRQVLWLGRDFEIDPRYDREREAERGRVRWSLL
ncbi:MAG: phytanoyl-CoA dioxygenase family protein [Candidatus Latescibacterota bacterium]|nr:phytanoyl-CoA dioxygenase family protein [Candidatus Latescibacterota bacterium]